MNDVTVPRMFLERVLDCITNHCMQRTYSSGVLISNVAIELRQALEAPQKPQPEVDLQSLVSELRSIADSIGGSTGEGSKPVAWRWLYRDGTPDSERCFPMPGPDADIVAGAAAAYFPRTVQYLWDGPPPKLDDIEQYRMQMTAISTAALGYFKEGDSIHPDYVSPALGEVTRLYEAYAARSEALRSVLDWMEDQADGQSKGGHATFDLMRLREQRDIARAALGDPMSCPALAPSNPSLEEAVRKAVAEEREQCIAAAMKFMPPNEWYADQIAGGNKVRQIVNAIKARGEA